MKKIIDNLRVIGIITILLLIIAGIGYIDFKLWRAEHPTAKTFTFFINRR
jgi:hypothetical protein